MNKPLFYTRRIHGLYGLRKAAYFLLQTQLRPRLFDRWFSFAEAALPPSVSERYRVRLVMRPAFRFINPKFDAATRINALTHHYTILKNIFPDACRLTLTQEDSGYKIASITGKSGTEYILETRGHVTKEGSLRIVFVDPETGYLIATLAGVLMANGAGKTVFYIGMMRGPGSSLIDNKEVIVKITKDLSGLRPKQAVLHAAAAFAAWCGAVEIIAPSSDAEIAMKNWFKGHRVLANHDSFWQEFAPAPSPDGLYHLPLPLPRRDVGEVQQKRRKNWLQRYAHIDDFSTEIKSTLDEISHKGA